jgi:predicted small lipoprotein YifL
MRSSFIPGIIVISASLLAGCGHKGPLMLPEAGIQTSPVQKPVTPASGVPAKQAANK